MKPSLFSFIFLWISLSATAQPSTKILENSLEQARLAWGVPGMSVGIIYKNQKILNKGFGVKEQGKSDAINSTTQFAIASNTKAFVSAALSTLVSQNKISWDDPVIRYLPDFEMYDPYVTAHLTIRDLLCHRSGLGTFSGDVIWYKSELPASEVIKKIKYVPQAFEFRSGYGYSNLMFITAGEVIRSVTQMNWDDYVKSTFIEPLDMNETITSTDQLSDNRAIPHKPDGKVNLPIDWVNWDNMGAAGGIISSSDDMTQWIQLLLNKGIWKSDTIIEPDLLHEMWTPHNSFPITESSHLDIPGRHFNGYGLGWGVYDYFGRKVITHSGGYDGMYSRLVLLPDEQLGFVLLTNTMTGIITPVIFDIINQFIKEDTRDWHAKYLDRKSGVGMEEWIEARQNARQIDTQPRLSITSYAGQYFDPMYGTITIQVKDDKLRLSFENAPLLNASLEHWHHDTWQILWDETHAWFNEGWVTFEMDVTNSITEIKFDVPNYDIFFHEINAKKK